jgi:hypothetical protein
MGEYDALNELVNIGTPTTAIHWEILSSHLPGLLFPLISIAQNPINEPTDSGYERFSNDPGTYQGHILTEIGTVAPSNVFTTVYESGTNSFHFYNSEQPYLIVNNGLSDMPATVGYKWLMLATCYSGIYYLDNFPHETVFYLETAGYMDRPYTKLFVQAVIEEKTKDELKIDLNALNPGIPGNEEESSVRFNYN